MTGRYWHVFLNEDDGIKIIRARLSDTTAWAANAADGHVYSIIPDEAQ